MRFASHISTHIKISEDNPLPKSMFRGVKNMVCGINVFDNLLH